MLINVKAAERAELVEEMDQLFFTEGCGMSGVFDVLIQRGYLTLAKTEQPVDCSVPDNLVMEIASILSDYPVYKQLQKIRDSIAPHLRFTESSLVESLTKQRDYHRKLEAEADVFERKTGVGNHYPLSYVEAAKANAIEEVLLIVERQPKRESGNVLEALRQAKHVIEHMHPLIKVAGVPPMARKIGVMSGIATSGAHQIKRVLPLLDAAITEIEVEAQP